MIAPLPPIDTVWTDSWHLYHFMIAAGSGVGAQRVFNAFVKSMPALPPEANWFERWGYGFLKLLADTEPNGKNGNSH